jgi:hypothetical protein
MSIIPSMTQSILPPVYRKDMEPMSLHKLEG